MNQKTGGGFIDDEAERRRLAGDSDENEGGEGHRQRLQQADEILSPETDTDTEAAALIAQSLSWWTIAVSDPDEAERGRSGEATKSRLHITVSIDRAELASVAERDIECAAYALGRLLRQLRDEDQHPA